MTDVIIVPGRGVYPDGSLFKDPQSRVQTAVELYNQHVAPFILMSGGYSFHFDNHTDVNEAQSMKEYAIKLGVPANAILTEDASTHTLANAYFCKKVYCESRNWHDIVIVASKDHMPRVKYVFTKVFGPEYTLTYTTSRRVIGPIKYLKEWSHELASMKLTKEWLRDVRDGDDRTIRDIVLSKRPNDTMSAH